jgi:DNA-binding response OmpR family regulator
MRKFTPEAYRILVVDDSVNLLTGVETVLKDVGYQVMTALSGEEALELIKRVGLPHLALVDINMPPGMDGFEFCEVVNNYSDMPIIMLTAISQEETIVEAIERFAEDYITKPFSLDVLRARVRRVLRRLGDFNGSLDPTQKIDPHLSVNFAECLAVLDDQRIPLTPTETKLLYILMRSSPKAVNISFILRRLWPTEPSNEGRLRVYLHRLRSKLKIDHPSHHYVVSQRGAGYRFVPYDENASKPAK